MRAVLLDYGMGNLRSVAKALETVGFTVKLARSAEEAKNAPVLVLPGVGAFGDAMNNLKKTGLDRVIVNHLEAGRPFLGICLGLQLLFEKSYEHGTHRGLGLLRGEVTLLPPTVRVPHIGWNQLWFKKPSPYLNGLKEGSFVYFVHSYRVEPKDEEVVLTVTDYGEPFVSAVSYDNLLAVQFHPEKSQKVGLKILKNFYLEALKRV
ncbi:MAG: imidazole glycerol phosphate synthase subunit HisH [Aquificae bacterium]|nr:imidazole glycerol phosphate synthase subunit HisH [Aquificota bacterium]